MRLQLSLIKLQRDVALWKETEVFSSEFKKPCSAKIRLNGCNQIELVWRKEPIKRRRNLLATITVSDLSRLNTCTLVYYIAKYQWTHFFEMLSKCCFIPVSHFNRSCKRNRAQKENKSIFWTRINFIFNENFFSKHFYVRFYNVCLLVWISANVFTFSSAFFPTIFFLYGAYSTLHSRGILRYWDSS